MCLRGFTHQPCFGNGVRQRLLAIDVFAQPHGANTRGGMRMVGRADGHGVNLISHRVQQLAVIVKQLGVWELLGLLLQTMVVDVTERDNLAVAGGAVGVAGAFAADSDAGDVHPLIGCPA